MPYVPVLDSGMYYEDLGDGNPVVLLHGNPTSSCVWRNVIPELTGQALGTLSSEELDTYRAPFTERAGRLPTLTWPREIPVDGESADVTRRVQAFDAWLASSTAVPKLLLTFDPGAIMTPPTITWCRDHIAALDVKYIGPGLHFVQETTDRPSASPSPLGGTVTG